MDPFTAAFIAALIGGWLYEGWAHRREMRDRDQLWTEERQGLLQRIQAPETAVAQHAAETATPDVPAVSAFDDNEFWEHVEERRVSS